MGMTRSEPSTALLQIPTTRVLARRIAPLVGLFGVGLAVAALRTANLAGRPYLWLGAIGLVGIAAYFGLLRTGIDVDAGARQVTVWWRWLGFGGRRTIDAAGKGLGVERTISRSQDSGSTDIFRIVLDDVVLHTISEHQGGAEAAEQLARRVAAHVGSPYAGRRDCPDMVRREAWRAKHAMLPLMLVVVAMGVGALVVLFTAP